MKKPEAEHTEMLDEYDFTNGVRGKYAKAMQAGYTITVHEEDGTTLVEEVHPKGMIVLEPDVREYFPDSESVNRTLRSLITLIPGKPKPAEKQAPRKAAQSRRRS